MSKIKINKRFLALLLAGTVTVGGVGFALKGLSNKNNETPSPENQIGYSNVNPWMNFNVNEEDFVILDMGDHDTVRTHFEHSKATFCNENDITLGVIISSDSETESAMYDDVEYAKSLIKKYDINFPVYLDINRIITNDNLNKEMKTKLIKNFIEKCSANNIYVGLYGTDTNLCRVKEYCGITGYDAYLVMDSNEIKYDGPYTVYQDQEGKITSTENISLVIDKKALNQANRFVNDGTYRIKYGEDIVDISLQCGLSVNELLAFNDLKKSDLVPGKILRIPSAIETTISEGLTVTYKELTEPIRGCDLSYAQGTDINWDKMSENFEFIILRCSQGLSEDATFESNAMNASLNNIPIGVYCFNDFDLDNCVDMQEFIKKQEQQAELTLELLKNKNIDYPVYLDIEGSNIESVLDKEAVNAMLDIWYNKIASAGYTPGLYCNQSGFKYLQSKVDYDLTEKLEVWIAGGEQFTGETQDIPLSSVVPSESVKENIPGADIIQATDSAVGAGAGNYNGHLDVNFSYYDYTEKDVTGSKKSTYPEKEFQRDDTTLIGIGLAGSCAVAAGLGIFGVVRDRKKKGSKVKAKYLKKDA